MTGQRLVISELDADFGFKLEMKRARRDSNPKPSDP
jgi:hypothetical protein